MFIFVDVFYESNNFIEFILLYYKEYNAIIKEFNIIYKGKQILPIFLIYFQILYS